MKTYKVGIIGGGGVSELHFEGYKEHPERVQVTALCDPNPDTLKARADKYGVAERYTSLEEFIAKSGVDVAVVCTPSPLRKSIIEPLLAAGLPVFVEKPFSDTLAEAQQIVDLSDRHGVPVSVNQNFRRHFPFEVTRDIVAEGTIGKVTSVLFTNLFFRQDSGWRVDCERHALSVMGIHWFDGVRLLLGADAKSVHGLNRSSAAVDCKGETDATVQVTFSNDAVMTYVQSFSSIFNRTEMIVIGEEGTLHVEHGTIKLLKRGQQNPVQSWQNAVSRETATYEGLNQLLAAVESGKEAPNSAQDNLKTIQMLDAAYVSASEGRIVQI
ncbi:Gfo/Idh/MocA family protein [Paenibacillus sp. 1P07SE]|uniref:Gfo/Idh/MocA family protein n=1 Tax=Paenibacillus sp. 1P07SE TaxID=3132209 RepID=UPI0039A67B31